MCKHNETEVQILYCYLHLNCICMYYGLEDLFEQFELTFGQLSNGQTTKFQTVVNFGFDTNNTSPFSLGM